MNKKTFTILLAACFIAIAAFHFALNFNRRNQPPSNVWSKEVLISSGNVQSNPSFIRYKDYYIVAHSDGDKIKILSVDSMGKKLNEKVFNAKGDEPLSTNVVTDGKDLYLYWTISKAGNKTIYNVKLDDKLNTLEEGTIENSNEVVSIGENVIAVNYKDKIGVTDLSTGKSYSVPSSNAEFLSAARNRQGYVISFKQGREFEYFTIINGTASELKQAANLEDVTSIAYVNSTLIADDNFGYILMEYRNKGEFGGTKMIKFSLKETGKFDIDEFKVNKSKVEVLNLSPYYSEGEAKFLAQQTVRYYKKKYYDDIVEINVTMDSKPVLLSRSKELSMFSAAVGDKAIFCDLVGRDKFNVYMTSKDEQFKAVHNNVRLSDIKLALIDTIGELLFSFVYILPYGMLWIIPTIAVISLYSIFEYKTELKKKKIMFVLIYLAFFVFKSLGIHSVSFKRFGALMPAFMTFGLSLVFSAILSLLCCFYAYKRYTREIEDNISIMNLALPMVYDSILSLMVVVPFIV